MSPILRCGSMGSRHRSNCEAACQPLQHDQLAMSQVKQCGLCSRGCCCLGACMYTGLAPAGQTLPQLQHGPITTRHNLCPYGSTQHAAADSACKFMRQRQAQRALRTKPTGVHVCCCMLCWSSAWLLLCLGQHQQHRH
jgi:hypothetical protein